MGIAVAVSVVVREGVEVGIDVGVDDGVAVSVAAGNSVGVGVVSGLGQQPENTHVTMMTTPRTGVTMAITHVIELLKNRSRKALRSIFSLLLLFLLSIWIVLFQL